MADPCCPDQEFTILSEGGLQKTLAGALTCCVDKIRDLNTKFGVRPYIVRWIETRFTGGRRGHGKEEVVREEHVLPTPWVQGIGSMTRNAQSAGTDEQGEVRVTEISARYTEDQLLGRGERGEPLPIDRMFYWEIEYPNRDGTFPGVRRRFWPSSTPELVMDDNEWRISLKKSGEDRDRRDGEPAR